MAFSSGNAIVSFKSLVISVFLIHLVSLVKCDPVTHIARVSMSKIKGTVSFTQYNRSSPTTIKFDLKGITEDLTIKIHDLPMLYEGGPARSCRSHAIGMVYDPTNSASGDCSELKPNKCAVGDISGKIGNINQASVINNFTDINLPLSGKYSIYSRTLVLTTTSGVVKACALIDRDFGPGRTVMAQFKGPVAGTVYFRQVVEGTVTVMLANLFFVNKLQDQEEFFLEIHDKAVGMKFGPDQCSNVGALYNPFKVTDRSHCNKTNHAGCPVGDLSTKDGYVNVSAATGDLSSTQVAYTDANLPINGQHSIIGHSLVLYRRSDPTKPVTCANVTEVFRRVAKVFFDADKDDGVFGFFIFKQASPFDPTDLQVNVYNLRSKAEGFHVHEYPNPAFRHITKNTEACSLALAGDHLNPYGIDPKTSPANGSGTFDEYEIGDLSAKFGSFLNKNFSESSYSDLNLPLFGRYSIIGRSLVIHNLVKDGNKRWVCANIDLREAISVTFNAMSLRQLTRPTYKKTVLSHFIGPDITGDIMVEQSTVELTNGAPFDSGIYLYLKHTGGEKTLNHNWHVHEKPVGDDQSTGKCETPGPHYNPYLVNVEGGNYKATCTPNNPLRCELGDTSAKTAQYSLGSGPKFYTDMDTPLYGEYSVVGRSFVMHVKDGGAGRQACADIKPYPPPSSPSHASHVTPMVSYVALIVMVLVLLI